MAHVRPLPKKQDGSRRYQVRYVAPDGRERAKTFARKADVDRFAALVETDKGRGEWIDPRLGKTTVEEWAQGWLQRLAHVRPKTRVGYESLLRRRVEVAEAVSDVNGRLEHGPTKTFERRWVRLPQFMVERLARQLESVAAGPEELVFRGQRGAPLRYQSFRRAVWDKAVMEAGLPEGLTRIASGKRVTASSWPVAPTPLPSSGTSGTGTSPPR